MFNITYHQGKECKSKPQWAITSHLSEWLLAKRQEITSVGENGEKKEPSCTVGEIINWCSQYGKEYGGASKN